ncbi:putative disease resistance RPP13-like protein 1 [Acorus calamus]|uniref:Disease resistance RPP13-like protein 1 n=1 Tax=Acorus calamus TaxID=4465 RepID=A0AAV9EYZ8_ACOCL|nr:putative disease resistance RPP13-like protein 1 [Acorus calamus]
MQPEVDDETETSSFIEESLVLGREIDKEKIVEELMQFKPKEKHIPVITIVGMVGVGKTTLAQNLYNDQRVTQYFELKMWIHVTRGSTVYKITKELLEIVTKQKCKISNMELMQRQLEYNLRGRRYLIVIDNMWNISQSDWKKLRYALDIGAMEGSKIIVTSQNANVARTMDVKLSHDLKILSVKDSWTLFCRCAFGDSSPDAHPELVSIGKKIVKMAEGLPLALIKLGGLLRF